MTRAFYRIFNFFYAMSGLHFAPFSTHDAFLIFLDKKIYVNVCLHNSTFTVVILLSLYFLFFFGKAGLKCCFEKFIDL